MARSHIHSAGPRISQKEIDYVADAITNGWYDNCYSYIEEFQKAFSEYIGIRHSLATSHGTGALHLALAANGVGPGDEVIVPEISWIATANVIKYCGAEPVFSDVRLEDWNLDPNTIEESITSRTACIFPVHLYGHPADMDSINNIARKHNLMVVEDAAPSVGSRYQDKPPGIFGKAAGFSFQGAKMLATGQGGMFVTDDDKVFERATSIYNHGRDATKGTFFSSEVGFNYKMPNLVAAMGLAQLERIDELISHKHMLRDLYITRLGNIDGFEFQKECNGAKSNWSYPSIRVDPNIINRDKLIDELSKRGIDTRPVFPRMSTMPAFKEVSAPRAELISITGINLPTAGYLEEEDVDIICDTILEISDIQGQGS